MTTGATVILGIILVMGAWNGLGFASGVVNGGPLPEMLLDKLLKYSTIGFWIGVLTMKILP